MTADVHAAVGNVLATAIQFRKTHKRRFAPQWYEWQRQAMCPSDEHPTVMVLAGNRTGKTSSAGFAVACHATGDYPDDWDGIRFEKPPTIWVFGVDATQVKDVLQRELVGKDEDDVFVGGWIHADEIVSFDRSHLPGALRELRVRHPRGQSTIAFKSYTQVGTGQSTLPHAGASVDMIWVDEQPPDELTGQLAARIMTGRQGKGGLLLYTMTPELGRTALIDQFMDPKKRQPHQLLIGPVAWSRCAHLTPEVQKRILAEFPEHERDMRSLGVPMMGEGRVFTVAEDRLRVQDFDLRTRPWMRVLKAIDIGITHPTAIVWMAFDPETDVTYLVRTYRAAGEKAAVHAAVANGMWPTVPVVVPPDIDGLEKGSGELTSDFYREAGMSITLPFENPDGSKYVEPGILDMGHAMATDRFKVFASCEEFFDEYRTYHRKDGKIVKERDDVMSAARYCYQMIHRNGRVLADVQRARPVEGLYPQLNLQTRGNRHERTRRTTRP